MMYKKEIYEKMKRRDFGESMSDETKLKVLDFVERQIRLYKNDSDEYKYFISFRYNHKDGSEGFGNCVFTAKRKMDTELIAEIEEIISEDNDFKICALINFQLL